METFYCTITSKYYLPRALCLYNSFLPFFKNKIFAFFCSDNEGADILKALKLKYAKIFYPADFETDLLKKLKNYRNISEYSWTCKSIILKYAMNLDIGNKIEWFIYLDSDMMVFNDPDIVFKNKSEYNIIITPHDFANKKFLKYKKVGKYNAGYIAFKNNKESQKALQWWNEQCINVCNSTVTDEVYGDQKYLDSFHVLFKGVYQSVDDGLNIAPWNIESYKIGTNNKKVYVNDSELLIYHFQGIKIFRYNIYDLYNGEELRIHGKLFKYIYSPFMIEMINSFKQIKSVAPKFNNGISKMRFRYIIYYLKKIFISVNNLRFKW